jgi:hypothetical protein
MLVPSKMEQEIAELRAAVRSLHTQVQALHNALHQTAPLAIAAHYVLMADPLSAHAITAFIDRFQRDVRLVAERLEYEQRAAHARVVATALERALLRQHKRKRT